MKKFIWSLLLSFFLLIVVVGTFNHVSASSSKLFLNSEPLQSEVSPFVVNNVTLVPLAVIFNGLGQDVNWDGSTKQVTITAPNTVIQLSIGSNIAKVNNEPFELPVAASLVQNRTMIPLRFVSENLGFTVNYIKETKDIYIEAPITKEPEPAPAPVEPAPAPTPSAPNPDEQTELPPASTTAKAIINSISLDENQSIQVSYTGEISQPSLSELSSPRRLIVDLPNMDFTESIYMLFENGQAQHSVENNSQYKTYRYALFNRKPLVARVVVELSDDAKYQLKLEEGKLTIVFGDQVNEQEPIVPNLLVEHEELLNKDPNYIYQIVLDPGHGDQDPGAPNKSKGLYEKTFNLSFGLKLKAELEKYNRINVHMTRADDSYLTLDERIAFAENVPTLNARADMFISIHANSFDNPSINGVETYYYSKNSKSLAEAVHPVIVKTMGSNDRKVRTAGFKVIKHALMPAILLEVGYMSNSTEVEKLFDTSRQDKLAAEVAKAIAAYLKL